jgi:hypothetical protein
MKVTESVYNSFKRWLNKNFPGQKFLLSEFDESVASSIVQNPFFQTFVRDMGYDIPLPITQSFSTNRPAPTSTTSPITPTSSALPSAPNIVSSGGYDWYWESLIDPTTGQDMGTWKMVGATGSAQRERQQWADEAARWWTQNQQQQFSESGARTAEDMQRVMAALGGQTGYWQNHQWIPTGKTTNVITEKYNPDTGQQKAQATQWEQARDAALQTYSQDPNRNWITMQNAQLQENPYEPAKPTRFENTNAAVSELEEYEKTLESTIKNLDKRINDPKDNLLGNDPMVQALRQQAVDNLNSVRNQLTTAQSSIMNDIQNKAMVNQETGNWEWITPEGTVDTATYNDWASRSGGTAMPESKGVATPDWLTRFAPNLTGKKFIPGTGNITGKAPQVAAPSAQAFSGLAPTQKANWAGYAEFAGQSPENLLWQTSSMIPQVTSLGRNWQPARSRI